MKIIILVLLFIFSQNSLAEKQTPKELEESFCAYGSHKELYQFFSEKDFIVVAQGKRIHDDGYIKDFADVLFLVSPDMEHFHAVTLHGIRYDHFKACIFTSARELDFQFVAPVPGLLERKSREHFVFLFEDMPNDGQCSESNIACTPWPQWSSKIKEKFLLSGYAFPSNSQHDPYAERVELTLDTKKINPTRGALTQHARKKYALRLRNELKESKDDIDAAKTAYKGIHNEIDHKLPLILFNLSDNRHWVISEIDRKQGVVNMIIKGKDLELYPMPNKAYKKFLEQ